MKALENIKPEMPQAIDFVEMDVLEYGTTENRLAYAELVKKEAIKYYKSLGEENDELSKYNISVIELLIDDLEKALIEEKEKNKKQREKIKEYLKENDLNEEKLYSERLGELAAKITSYYYPKFHDEQWKKKKESIRQELIHMRDKRKTKIKKL